MMAGTPMRARTYSPWCHFEGDDAGAGSCLQRKIQQDKGERFNLLKRFRN